MSIRSSTSRSGSSRRAAQVRRVLEECLRRRSAGEQLGDEELLAAHPELMPELGEELRLLALMQRAGERVRSGSTIVPRAAVDFDVTQRLPTSFNGRYELIGEIHRGGQGIVCEGRESESGRRVAIKVMRIRQSGATSDRIRFEREAQILEALHHPNIVAIRESGRTAEHFFLVMDYVEGEPLDVYMARVKPEVRDALDLLAKVCEAVNVAHLHGVIHRDIKPGNIRVGRDGVPHVLDFGLAKLADGQPAGSSSRAAVTMTGQFVGSLPWASPEQARGEMDIDLRTDVYSLGVLLFQMLTGSFPYGVTGSMRTVVERIATSLPRSPHALRPQLGNEVETILLRCLSKERERRYQTAGEIARDIRRHLAGEPIEAKRDSAWYVLRKMLARHKITAAFSAALLVLVLGSSIALTVLYAQQTQARHAAEAAQAVADEAREAEHAQRRRAEAAAQEAAREAARADAVKAFLQKMLVAADPRQAKGRDLTVRAVLDDAARRLKDGMLADQPVAEAEVRATVAHTYYHLGLYVAAIPHYEKLHAYLVREFGEANHESLRVLTWLAKNYSEAGRYEDARAAYQRCLNLAVAEHGDDEELTLTAMSGLGEVLMRMGRIAEAETLQLEALEGVEQSLGHEHELVVSTTFNLGDAVRAQGRLEDAERLYRKALALSEQLNGDDSYITIRIRWQLARDILLRTGRADEAEQLLSETLRLARAGLGDEHPETVVTLTQLSRVLRDRGADREAERLLRESIAQIHEPRAVEENDTICVFGELASLLADRGDKTQAASVLGEAIAAAAAAHGEEYRVFADWLDEYAELLVGAGDYERAIETTKRSLDVYAAVEGPVCVEVASECQQLGWYYSSIYEYERGIEWYERALDLRRRLGGEADGETIRSTVTMAYAMYGLGGRDEEAIDLLRDRHTRVVAELGVGHPFTRWARTYLAQLLSRAGHIDEAMALDFDMIDVLSAELGPRHSEVALWWARVGQHRMLAGDAPAAIDAFEEAMAIYRAGGNDRMLSALTTQANLADALVAAGRSCEAIEPVRAALDGLCATRGGPDWHATPAMITLGLALTNCGRAAEAEPILRNACDPVAAQYSRPAMLDQFCGEAESALGLCLAGLGRFEEAEPLVLRGYDRVCAIWRTNGYRARMARARIVELYKLWGRPDEAEAWRADPEIAAE